MHPSLTVWRPSAERAFRGTSDRRDEVGRREEDREGRREDERERDWEGISSRNSIRVHSSGMDCSLPHNEESRSMGLVSSGSDRISISVKLSSEATLGLLIVCNLHDLSLSRAFFFLLWLSTEDVSEVEPTELVLVEQDSLRNSPKLNISSWAPSVDTSSLLLREEKVTSSSIRSEERNSNRVSFCSSWRAGRREQRESLLVN